MPVGDANINLLNRLKKKKKLGKLVNTQEPVTIQSSLDTIWVSRDKNHLNFSQ